MQKSVNIKCSGSYRFYGITYLVRGLTRRAIRVVFSPFPIDNTIDRDEIILLAAERAVKNNWKTIFVFPDMCDGEEAYTANTLQFMHCDEFQYVKYLCEVSQQQRRIPVLFDVFVSGIYC